jgi:hypothetical protein
MTPLFTDPVLFGMMSAEDGYETFLTESNAILAQNAE